MKIVRADEVSRLASTLPSGDGGLEVNWFEGPSSGNQLDVGLVTLSEQGVTPPHVHFGGQLIFVLSGRGFVETADERIVVGPGDVVVTPPGELHTHGAEGGEPMAHLTVTTGGYSFPDPKPT
jgi:quercetin dioxygenase-like cupin family protein